jgi:hypothetical protein
MAPVLLDLAEFSAIEIRMNKVPRVALAKNQSFIFCKVHVLFSHFFLMSLKRIKLKVTLYSSCFLVMLRKPSLVIIFSVT